MTYEPPTNASIWQVIVFDEGHNVTTLADATAEYGLDSLVTIAVRRLSALPIEIDASRWSGPMYWEPQDVAHEWDVPCGDDPEEPGFQTRLAEARALADELNGAPSEAARAAATLHMLADRLATYTGPFVQPKLDFHLYNGIRHDETDLATIDALSLHMMGVPAETVERSGWYYEAEQKLDGVTVKAWMMIPDPAEAEKEQLRAKIAELEAKLAGGAA